MDEEYQSFMKKNTWDLVPLPLERNLVRCKWGYKTNMVVDGLISKYQERLVAKCFS